MGDRIPKKRVRFKGNFRDLKNYGYKFWKAYARNYKVYTKSSGCKTINIWVGGREVEFDDLAKKSYLLFEKLKGFEIDICDKNWPGGFSMKIDFAKIVFNKKLECLEEYDRLKHSDIHLMGLDVSVDEMEKILKEYYETYKVVIINQKHIDLVNELWDNDLIEIIPDDRWK